VTRRYDDADHCYNLCPDWMTVPPFRMKRAAKENCRRKKGCLRHPLRRSRDPNPANRMFIGMKADAGIVHYTSITLKDCIRAAYRVRDFQIQGPDWMSSVRFDINAKLPAGASTEQIPEMMQALLAERFGMVLEHGTKEQTVYALVTGRDGPKLKPGMTTAGRHGPAIYLGQGIRCYP
jgi:uncharacterized protein (TIGR03435 family)